MESEFGGPRDSSDLPNQSEADDALHVLDADAARLAARVVTPRWYYVVVALIEAVSVVAFVLPTAVFATVMAVSVLALALLANAAVRREGVRMNPSTPQSKRLYAVILGLVSAGILARVAMRFAGVSPWWALVPATGVAIAIVALGPRLERTMRRDIAKGAAGLQ